jgi:gas vesicle protein
MFRRRRRKNPIAALLIGGVIGGATALFMAPASGRETRTILNTNINRILYRANDQKKMIIREAQKLARQVVGGAESIYNNSVSFAEGQYSNTADAIELQIRGFRNAIDAAIDAYKKTGSEMNIGRNTGRKTSLSSEVIVNEMISDFEDESLPKQEGMGRRQD